MVFGKTDGTAVELSDVEAGIGGFVINGVSAVDQSGWSVSGAGDVNGDSFDGQWVTGMTGTFTLQVTNLGASIVPPGTLIVTDDLPQGFIISSVSGGLDWDCSFTNGSPSTLTCDYIGPQVQTNQQLPLIMVTATPGELGEFENCANVELDGATDIDLSNNESCIPVVVGEVPGSG